MYSRKNEIITALVRSSNGISNTIVGDVLSTMLVPTTDSAVLMIIFDQVTNGPRIVGMDLLPKYIGSWISAKRGRTQFRQQHSNITDQQIAITLWFLANFHRVKKHIVKRRKHAKLLEAIQHQ